MLLRLIGNRMRQRLLVVKHCAEIAHIDPAAVRFVAFEKNGRLVRRLFVALSKGTDRGDRSFHQQLFDPLVELFERDCAFDPLGIDEEGRRRIDLQHLVGEVFIGG